MMCDECGVRPANIHVTTFVNGEKQERNLCATCMTKYKKQLTHLDIHDLADLFGGFFEKLSAHAQQQDNDRFEGTCPRCGTTYAEFKRSGALGCSECYKAFHEPLEELLVRVHGNAQHSGRVPGGVDSKVAVKLQIDRLKQQLIKAITNEEYEIAATLRDQIRALTTQLEKQQAEADKEGVSHE